MVMHARKPQRISDGYFEKHQTHPYQKYNSKRVANEYSASDNRYIPLRSPNGNFIFHGHGPHTGHSGHGHHHYAHMVDDRGYPTSRNSYMQKGFEKERDRDYKCSRNKYTDVRSPKEKRCKDIEREKNNHERCEPEKKSRTSGLNSSVNRSSKYDKRSVPTSSVPSSSEWSEHISSSGKRYYYNCVSEVSQWEKPREWETRRTSSKDSTYLSRNTKLLEEADADPITEAQYWTHRPKKTRLRKANRDKRSGSRSGRREVEKLSKRGNNATERYWREEDGHERSRLKHGALHDGKVRQSQDMDISPDRSTPLSEKSYGPRGDAVPPVVVLDNSHQQTGSLLAAALPRISAAPPSRNAAAPPPRTTAAAPPRITAAPPVVGAGCAAGTSGPMVASGLPGTSGTAGVGGATPGSCTDSPMRDAGPPTPTHSENTDPHAPPLHLENALPRKMECLGSYSSVVGNMREQAPAMLSPTLINYVRSDLSAHVYGWPADILEKQANKFTEEAYQLGCLQCTRVTAELKCSRSVVRHTEIQATLQEQKIMYLRQQILRLEELKSQNSFMSED